MGFFVGIVIAILAIGFGVFAAWQCSEGNSGVGAIMWVLCIAAVITFIIVPFSFHTVDTGEVAVVKTFGEAKEVKGPGLNYDFWMINDYEYIDTKTQELYIETMAYSSDAQVMNIAMTVQYQVLSDKAVEIVKGYGSLEALTSRITAIITEQPKSVVSKRTAMDIIANRSAITPEVEAAIVNAIGEEYYVVINTVAITNIDFSDAFEQAVEEKMIAEQAKLKAEYENQTKIAQAQAEADAKLAQAQAEIEIAKAQAEAKKIAAEAEAEANKIITESLTEQIIEKILADAWNGELPDVVGNGEYILPSDMLQ